MYDNTLQVAYHSKLFAMIHPEAVLVLFDFKAAFPSLHHDFMWAVLQQLGFGPVWLHTIQCFYTGNLQFLWGKKSLAKVGIRQGCPSPAVVRGRGRRARRP